MGAETNEYDAPMTKPALTSQAAAAASGPASPITDPAAELSPTATRILAAARRLLAQKGFNALTLEAISAEAGENKSAIRYYFGSKDGLITALVDSVEHDDTMRLLRDLATVESADDRVALFMATQRSIADPRQEYGLFFDLLPHVLRDRSLCTRLAELYEWYRKVDAWALAPEASDEARETVGHLSAITIAVTDGLAIQIQADPEFDVTPALDLWERMLRATLADLGLA
jgi:AcrR family transcriptional regulator